MKIKQWILICAFLAIVAGLVPVIIKKPSPKAYSAQTLGALKQMYYALERIDWAAPDPQIEDQFTSIRRQYGVDPISKTEFVFAQDIKQTMRLPEAQRRRFKIAWSPSPTQSDERAVLFGDGNVEFVQQQ